MNRLEQIKIVLVEPTHPGNIGAVARAMKTMGLTELILVKAKKFPHYEATKRAASADDVLQRAQQVETVRDAVADCSKVFGTSVRDREVSWPTANPRQTALAALQHLQSAEAKVAILFGRESSGLSNEELDLCDAQIRIAANPDYSSLNLASAVQIVCYEFRAMALEQAQRQLELGQLDKINSSSGLEKRQQPATKEQREGHLSHLFEVIEALEFSKTKQPTLLMRKLTRLYNKAELTVEEIQILRGLLTAIQSRV